MISWLAAASSRRGRMGAWILLIGLWGMTASSAHGQHHAAPGQTDDTPTVDFHEAQGKFFTVTWRSFSGAMNRDEVNPADALDVIVEFNEAPFFIQQQDPEGAAKVEFFRARFAQVASDLARIYRNQAGKAGLPLPAAQIRRQFYKAFAGVAARIPRSALVPLQRLDYVKKVHLDQPVEALLGESVSVIRADSVWSRMGVLGDGVTVAVLDSGIDYLHPALGGGLGEGFKVIGGYDVVNDDADPMDDNGHGTHVAGIVAADGDSVRGVAPHAQLLAVKVLNEHGFGKASDLIAGLEHALDPDRDDDPSDRADIVNLSLGGGGHPDDPASVAVDNATLLGVTVVASAGNDGFDGFSTISSPGTARSAITVGAVEKQDGLASFTSKGPNPSSHSIKPDVVAPGVAIQSLARGGGLVQQTGTSMAAPHVAGVAALLKALHGDWTPDRIKAALVSTAQDLGLEVMAQGNGRVDALRAAEAAVLAVPSDLSFGLDNTTQTFWKSTQRLQIVNTSDTLEYFAHTASGRQPGVRVDVEPPRFTLRPGTAQDVAVTLTVENRVVPPPQEGSLAFGGTVTFTSERHTVRVPWAFVNAAQVRLTFNEPNPFFLITNEHTALNDFDGIYIDPQTYDVVVPRNDYDVLTIFRGDFVNDEPPRVVLRENVPFDGGETLAIRSTEAQHLVRLKGVDESGQTLASQGRGTEAYRSAAWLVYPSASRVSSLCLPRLTSDSLYVSTVSDRYMMLLGEFFRDDARQDLYVVQHPPFFGLDDDARVANAPTDLISQTIDIKLPREAPAPHVMAWSTFYERQTYLRSAGSSDFGLWDVPDGAWQGTLHLTPDVHPNYGFSAVYMAKEEKLQFLLEGDMWVRTEPFRIVDDSLASFFSLTPAPDIYRSPDGGTMRFGYAPFYPASSHSIQPDRVWISVWYFLGGLNEWRESDRDRAGYTLYDNQDCPIASEQGFRIGETVTPGRYRAVFTNTNYDVAGIPGEGRYTLRFDTRRSDPSPPAFTSMKLLDADGAPAGRLENGERATVLFSAIDPHVENDSFTYRPLNQAATRLRYRIHGADVWHDADPVEVWQEFEVAPFEHDLTGHLYRADLSAVAEIADAAVDLQIEVQDLSGNAITWVLEPAFAIGDVEVPVAVEPPPEAARPLRFQIHPNYPNPFNSQTTIRFETPRQETVRLTVYDLLGRAVRTLHDGPMPAGRHRLVWNGDSDAGQLAATGVYFYRISAGSFNASRTMMLVR